MPHGTEGLRQLPGPEDLPVRVRKVLSLLRQDGHLAYVVGGAVRDLLLGYGHGHVSVRGGIDAAGSSRHVL